jgi:hypothetical protein
MTVPVLLAVGDEDVRCLDTNLMLKSTLPDAGLWICPNTGHAINLEEPAAFNAQVEAFLGAVERGSWRRGYPKINIDSSRRRDRCSGNSLVIVDLETSRPDMADCTTDHGPLVISREA